MIGPLSAAATGMVAQTKRLQASAENIANVTAQAYVPQEVALSEGPGGGVQAEVLPPSPIEPTPHVDIEHELLDRMSAQRAYDANLAVLEGGVERLDALMELVG